MPSSTLANIGESISNAIGTIPPCDHAISIFYFYILILVLILAGNLIQKASKEQPLGWLAFSVCVILGLLGMFFIWAGKHMRTIGVIIINVIIVAFLMFAMIYTEPKVSMTEKVGAHFANICFLLVTIIAMYITRKSAMEKACEA